MTNCRFIANRSTGWQNGVGIYIDKGVCERSVFTGHTQGTPIYNAGGTVRNCLVYGNRTGTSSFDACKRFGGVYQSSGSLYNCTIVGNRSGKGVGGLRAEGDNVVNNIVWNNTSEDGSVGVTIAAGSTFTTNLVDAAISSSGMATGIIVSAQSPFKRVETGDYRLAVGSRAVDIGDNAIWAGVADATDIAGNPRIIPRRGVVDVGCYESPLPPATVIFFK